MAADPIFPTAAFLPLAPDRTAGRSGLTQTFDGEGWRVDDVPDYVDEAGVNEGGV